MIDKNKMYDVVYIAIPVIEDGKNVTEFISVICDNKESIYNILFRNKDTDIYFLEHWFETQEECNEYINKVNMNCYKYTMIDYFVHRFNLKRQIVIDNFRTLQKLRCYLNNYKKKKI